MAKRPLRENRLPSMEVSPESDLAELPPLEERRELPALITHVHSSDPSVSAQMVHRETRREPNGQLVDFAVILQISRNGSDWDDLVRIDTAHRFVHVHHPGSGHEDHDTAVVPRECRQDIDLAWEWAKNYAWDQAMREIM